MNAPRVRRTDRRFVVLAVAGLVAGCAHSREVVYPNGDGRPQKTRPRWGLRTPAPRVQVRVEDQPGTMPPMLGE